MKMLKFIYIFLLISFVSTAYSQHDRISVDSLIFEYYSDVPNYSYTARYDSLQIKIKERLAEMAKDSLTFVDYFPPKPEMFAVVNTNILSLNEYREYITNKYSSKIWCAVKFTIHWNGYISAAKLIAYQGTIPNFTVLEEIVRAIKAKPAINEANFPNPGPFLMVYLVRT